MKIKEIPIENRPRERLKQNGVEALSDSELLAIILQKGTQNKEANKHSANSIILVHNYPSGDCEPSAEDEQVTRKMKQASEIMGIKLLDYVIVSGSTVKSVIKFT